jgi:hypothetical protein
MLNIKLYSQTKAITEFGDNIIIYDNGTWESKEAIGLTKARKNPKSYYKPNTVSFLLKSKKANIGIWLNDKEWGFEKATNNTDAEYEFNFKNGDVYAMAIIEEVEIPLESLSNIALETLTEAAPNTKIVNKEYRIVNGIEVLFMRMDGTLQGIDFSYFGYYYSNKTGTIQLITYSSTNVIDKYKIQCEEFLNGITTFN